MNMALEDYAVAETSEMLRMEAVGLRFLAGLFLAPPTDSHIEQALSFLKTLGQRPCQECGDEIRIDFTRLFLGLRKTLAPPWESVYLPRGRRVFQEPTLAVRRAYLEAGFAHDTMFQIPDDHVGLELEFLASMNERSADALENGSPSQYQEATGKKERFIEEHLSLWIERFAADITTQAQTTFWKCVATVLVELFPSQENSKNTAIAGG
jgi:TorA maturation chaperone TorD